MLIVNVFFLMFILVATDMFHVFIHNISLSCCYLLFLCSPFYLEISLSNKNLTSNVFFLLSFPLEQIFLCFYILRISILFLSILMPAFVPCQFTFKQANMEFFFLNLIPGGVMHIYIQGVFFFLSLAELKRKKS